MKFKVKEKKTSGFLRGLLYLKGADMKEYILKIVYDGKSDEISHLSEQFSCGFSIEINGEDIPISDEMGRYMLENLDSEELGVS